MLKIVPLQLLPNSLQCLSGSAWTFDPATQDTCSNALVFDLQVSQGTYFLGFFRVQEYYYHAFGEFQPDLNYRNPEVVEAGELNPSFTYHHIVFTCWELKSWSVEFNLSISLASEGHERSSSLLAATRWPSAASRGWQKRSEFKTQRDTKTWLDHSQLYIHAYNYIIIYIYTYLEDFP